MEIKVIKAVGSASRTTSTLDLVGNLKVSPATKAKIQNDVGEYLVEQILSSAHREQSPVAGEGRFQKLSAEYAAKKKAEGAGTKANLELEGDLLDALTFETTRNGIEIGWFGSEAAKADGHNNLSGESHIPTRRVLPDMGQEFNSEITKGIESIIADNMVGGVQFERADFEEVASKAELYDTLDEYFPGLSKAEVRAAVSRSPDLAALLDDMDLLKLL